MEEERRTERKERRKVERNSTDRRHHRVQKTERLLEDAIVGLCSEKNYSQITIEDILNRSGVTRTTFYGHFATKEELISSVANTVIGEVLAAFSSPANNDGTRMLVVFKYVEEHVDQVKILLNGAGDGAGRRVLLSEMATILLGFGPFGLTGGKMSSKHFSEMACHIAAGEILASVSWWVNLEKRPAKEKIANDLRLLLDNHQLRVAPKGLPPKYEFGLVDKDAPTSWLDDRQAGYLPG